MTLRRFFSSFLACSIPLFYSCQGVDPALYECEQLLEEINLVVIDAQTLTQNEQTNDGGVPNLDIWLQAADRLKTGAEAIAELSISDNTLKTHQTEISTIYSEQAQATYGMVQAWQNKDLQAALKAQQQSAAAGTLEATAGEALNTYCQNKEKEAQT
ncbi:MAG: hypothetical protein WBB82_08095 [Limnothrix sp.]